MRNENGFICMMGKYHNILYVALKLCFIWQLKDTGTIATLLEHIYMCERTFERLLVGAIFGTKAPHYIAGWKSDFDNQEENLHAVVYFLDHANNANLELPFGSNGKLYRFIDVPIESCGRCTPLKVTVQLGVPDKLHIFLRFGASIYNDNDNGVTVFEHILNRLMEFNHVYPYNLVACLQLLLRVVPCIKLDKHVSNNDETNTVHLIIMEKYSDLLEDGLIPFSRSGLCPPELKHLCRCVIRKRLWENFLLPNGIHCLPIPESLWRYIDIMED